MKIINSKESITKKKTKKKLSVISLFLCLILVVVTALLAIQNMRFIAVAPYTLETERVELMRQSVGIAVFILTVAALMVLVMLIKRAQSRPVPVRIRNAVLVCALIAVAVMGMWLIRDGAPAIPGDDTGICWSVAYELVNSGDTASFEPGGYLVRYPQQAGIVWLWLLLFKHFGAGETYPFYIMNLALMLLMVLFGALTVRDLEGKLNGGGRAYVAEPLFIVFTLTNLPALLYICYLYGETAQSAAMVVGAYAIARTLDEGRLNVGWLTVLLISVAVGVSLRKNTMIFVVACVIVLLIRLVREVFPWRVLLVLISVVAVAAVTPKLLSYSLYESAGVERPSDPGIPAAAFIAMGLQDEWNGPGWYNDYNRVLYEECGEDATATGREARTEILRHIEVFKNDLSYCTSFFSRKLSTQWCEPTCDALYCSLKWFGGDGPIIGYMRTEDGQQGVRDALSVRQVLILTGVMLYALSLIITLVRGRRHVMDTTSAVLMLTLLGAVAFSLIWEAKSRYVVEYLAAVIPLAAAGFGAGISDIIDH